MAGITARLCLPEPLDPGLRYQLFHRTAAAVIEAEARGASAAMIVQSFSETSAWFADFAAFARLFGLDAAIGWSGRATLPGGRSLILGWASGDPAFRKALSADA